VEREGQYKDIIEKENKEWKDRNADNIKRLLRMKNTKQL
jgi:hypothetical protein